MKTLLVKSENEKDFKFLLELMKKLGFESRVLYEEDLEDAALLNAMVKEKKGDYVSEQEIMNALEQNEG